MGVEYNIFGFINLRKKNLYFLLQTTSSILAPVFPMQGLQIATAGKLTFSQAHIKTLISDLGAMFVGANIGTSVSGNSLNHNFN